MPEKLHAGFLVMFFLVQAGMAQPVRDPTLREFIEERFSARSPVNRRNLFNDLCPVDSNVVAARVFREYGAVFASGGSVTVPNRCIFLSEQEVSNFQDAIETKTAKIGGVEIELQEAAMNALLDAVRQAEARRLRITPLDGAIAGRRSFADAVRVWNSRFVPALNYWVARGRIKKEDADAALKLPAIEQTHRVLDWESRGLYFSTGKNRSIMSSVAPPGTSQHLSMLAFDIEQAGNRTVGDILNRNGWFQTVVNDSPHFTYLGVPGSELPKRGLRSVGRGGHSYWVPVQ